MRTSLPATAVFLLLCAVPLFTGCDGIFPPQQKIGPPADHTVNIKGAMHKPGFKFPYRTESGCADASCHHDDLDGGVAQVDGRVTVAPSCFQCHGTKWED